MTHPIELIEVVDAGDFRVDATDGRATIQPAISGSGKVYVSLNDPTGLFFTNQQAIALGLAIIQCAKHSREAQS